MLFTKRQIFKTLCILIITAGLYSSVACAHGSKKEKFFKGYYIDSLGQKTEGLISYDGSDLHSFLYKKELEDEAKKITDAKCNYFYFDNHTYEALDSIELTTLFTTHNVGRVFAEKVIPGGIFTLYKLSYELKQVDKVHHILSSASNLSKSDNVGLGSAMEKDRANYFLKKQGEKNCVRVKMHKDAFKTQMEMLLSNDTALVQKIDTNKNYNFHNIELIIQEYNADKTGNDKTN